MPTSDDCLPPEKQTLQEAFERLVSELEAQGATYAIIGGLAIIQHTRVRTTDDIDALISVSQIGLVRLFEALQNRGFTVDVMRSIQELRDDGATTIAFGDVLVDLLRPVIPAYGHVLDRAIQTKVLGRPVRIGDPEGLIVTKLIAMRPQDEADIQELLIAYAGKLDLGFIRAELDTFADATDPRRFKFEQMIRASS